MGGKRKSAKRIVVKKKKTVAKVFNCPFCSHESSCEVKIDKKVEAATISCRVCGESYQTRTTHLTEPVDVFVQWVDACEAARLVIPDVGGVEA